MGIQNNTENERTFVWKFSTAPTRPEHVVFHYLSKSNSCKNPRLRGKLISKILSNCVHNCVSSEARKVLTISEISSRDMSEHGSLRVQYFL